MLMEILCGFDFLFGDSAWNSIHMQQGFPLNAGAVFRQGLAGGCTVRWVCYGSCPCKSLLPGRRNASAVLQPRCIHSG